MRIILTAFLIGIIHLNCCYGQNKVKLGIATNLAKLAYYTGQLDVLACSKDARLMGLIGLLYTNGHIYGGNKTPIDDKYMKNKSSRVFGWGTDIQVRYKMFPSRSPENGFYIALGLTYNKYRVTFYENQYIYNAGSGMYHYGLASYTTNFFQTAVHGQIFYSANILKLFHTEIGCGVAQNMPKTSDLLDTYRDFGKDVWGFAVKGLSPVFTCRLGYWLYR